jgi:hypothetical protein
LSYPSSTILPQLVYAISTKGAVHAAYSVEATWGQPSYTLLGVTPGTYFVFSTLRPVRLNPNCWSVSSGSGYTDAVTCGLNFGCNDHRPIAVTVRAGETTAGIDVSDWYAGPTYGEPPAPPPGVVPDALWSTPTYGAFPTALQALNDYVPGRYEAFLADPSRTNCPVNRACVSTSALHSGTDAAYATAIVGSNSDLLACVFLTYRDAAGWQVGRESCNTGSPFPVVGGTGVVWLGVAPDPKACLQVRAQPGFSGKVVGCLGLGASVTIDDGPVYIPQSSGQDGDGFWWHLQDKGWASDFYLRAS